MRRTKLPTNEISKAYKCPVCGKPKLFTLKFGELAGRVKRCEKCGYTNSPVNASRKF